MRNPWRTRGACAEVLTASRALARSMTTRPWGSPRLRPPARGRCLAAARGSRWGEGGDKWVGEPSSAPEESEGGRQGGCAWVHRRPRGVWAFSMGPEMPGTCPSDWRPLWDERHEGVRVRPVMRATGAGDQVFAHQAPSDAASRAGLGGGTLRPGVGPLVAVSRSSGEVAGDYPRRPPSEVADRAQCSALPGPAPSRADGCRLSGRARP